jgi:hypothetical protein
MGQKDEAFVNKTGWDIAEENRPVDHTLLPGQSKLGYRNPHDTPTAAATSVASAAAPVAPAAVQPAPAATTSTAPVDEGGLFAKIKAAITNNEVQTEAEIEKLMHGG